MGSIIKTLDIKKNEEFKFKSLLTATSSDINITEGHDKFDSTIAEADKLTLTDACLEACGWAITQVKKSINGTKNDFFTKISTFISDSKNKCDYFDVVNDNIASLGDTLSHKYPDFLDKNKPELNYNNLALYIMLRKTISSALGISINTNSGSMGFGADNVIDEVVNKLTQDIADELNRLTLNLNLNFKFKVNKIKSKVKKMVNDKYSSQDISSKSVDDVINELVKDKSYLINNTFMYYVKNNTFASSTETDADKALNFINDLFSNNRFTDLTKLTDDELLMLKDAIIQQVDASTTIDHVENVISGNINTFADKITDVLTGKLLKKINLWSKDDMDKMNSAISSSWLEFCDMIGYKSNVTIKQPKNEEKTISQSFLEFKGFLPF